MIVKYERRFADAAKTLTPEVPVSRSKLRVLTISKPYVAAAYRDKFAELARRDDVEVGLICPPQWGSQTFEAGTTAGYTIEQLGIRLNGRNHFHTYRGLTAAVRAFRPDVLNVEEEHYSLVTWQAFRAAQAVSAAPLFYTWQNIQKTYPPPFSWIERYVFAHAAGAAAGNHESIDVLRAKGYRGLVREIPQMGVTLERFAPADPSDAARAARKRALGLEEGAFWVAFLGRLVEEKGVQLLVEAAARVPQVRLLIGGSGPYGDALAALARERGVSERVRFAPQIPSVEVPAYLQAVDALCLPSLTRANWKEQFGRVLIEAMAAEAVVIGSSSGEIPRVIADAGLVFPEADAPALAGCLERLVGEPALASTLRAQARSRVREMYTNCVVADQFAELFHAAHAAWSRH
jgi:glycosyltransferase involved in cell wall biosynthesis